MSRMFELIYPEVPAPLVAIKSVPRKAEVLPVVDTSGIVIGRTVRSVCHDGSRLLHPVVHLHIISRSGCIYLQKRAASKDLYPGFWDTAVGGHVGYGETFGEALYREASEELGLIDFNPVNIDSYVYSNDHEQELISVYATITDREINPDNEEVEDGRYWKIEEVEASLGKGLLTPQFEQEFIRLKDRLLALL